MSDASVADPFGRIADEFVEEFRQGRRPSVEEYAQRYPDFSEEVREILPTLVMMERAKSLGGSIDGESAVLQDSSPLLGKELGDYRIIREVGRGGMGIVYEAEQVSLGRRVALKVLAKQALVDSNQRRRFDREARAAAKLHHTNIVPVFGVGEQDGLCYYVMQFIRGLGLDKVLDELKRMSHASAASGPSSRGELRLSQCQDASAAAVAEVLLSGRFDRWELAEDEPEAHSTTSPPAATLHGSVPAPRQAADAPPEVFTLSESTISLGENGETSSGHERAKTYWHSVARIGAQVAEALQYAHDQGITHRDVKPSNLLLDLRGTVWVTDFGLAKSDDHQNLTHSGDILGTIRYLPPETFDGKADARGDVYSLGLTLYELLALRPAFDEIDRRVLIKKVTTGEPTRLERIQAEVPRDLATIVHKAIERDAADRYQSAQQFADDLQRFVHDEPIQARRASLFEQARRWSRRNRELAFAIMGIASLLVIISLGAVGAAAYYRQQEEVQRQLHREAESQEEVTRRSLYAAQMSVAHQSWQGHRGTLRTESLLDHWRPQAGELDLRGWEWYYIHSLCHRELAALAGHTDAITCVAYSPDGSRLASAARDGTIRIWNTGQRTCEKTLTGHHGKVYSLSWDSTGSHLASAGDDGVVFWDAVKGEKRHTLPMNQPVFAVAFAPDDRRLALGVKGGPLEIWETGTWKKLHALAEHQADVYTETISFSPDGALLAAPSGNSVTVWKAEGCERLHMLEGHTDAVQGAVFSPDGRHLATSSRDATIKLWDARSGELQRTLAGHTHGVASVAWHPSQPQLASAAWDGTCRLWDLETGQEIAAPRGHARHVFSVAWHPSGNRLVTGGDDNLVKLWKPAHTRDPAMLVDVLGSVRGLHFSPNGLMIATGSTTGSIQLWNATTGTAIKTFEGLSGPISGVAFDPHSSQVAAACHDGNIVIYDIATAEKLKTLRAASAAAISVGWNPAGTRLVTTGSDGSVLLWDSATWKQLQELKGHAPAFTTARFSPDGKRLASGGDDGTLRLWDLESGQPQVMRGHIGRIIAVAWSQSGSLVATAGDDHTVRIWDAATHQNRFVLTGHSEVIAAVDFSPDGKRLMSADARGTIKLWDVTTGIETLTLHGSIGRLSAGGWSPSGTRIAANSDGKILIWDARVGYQLERTAGGTSRIPDSRMP